MTAGGGGFKLPVGNMVDFCGSSFLRRTESDSYTPPAGQQAERGDPDVSRE